MGLKSPVSAKSRKKKLGKSILGSITKQTPNQKLDGDNDGGLAVMDAPGKHYTRRTNLPDEESQELNAVDSRGRGLLRGRASTESSRSRSRSSSLFRRLRGKKDDKSDSTVDADCASTSRSTKEKKPKKATKSSSEVRGTRAIPGEVSAFHESIDFAGIKKKKKKKKIKHFDGSKSASSLGTSTSGDDGSEGVLSPSRRKKKKKRVKADGLRPTGTDGDTLGKHSQTKKTKAKQEHEREDRLVESPLPKRHHRRIKYVKSPETKQHGLNEEFQCLQRNPGRKSIDDHVDFPGDEEADSWGWKEEDPQACTGRRPTAITKASVDAWKTMQVKNQRADVHEALKTAVEPRQNRTTMMNEFKEKLPFRNDVWDSRKVDADACINTAKNTSVCQKTGGLDFVITKKLDDFDMFTSNWNESAREEREKSEESTVYSMTETVSSLNKQIEAQREDTRTLQKSLADALGKIAALNNELHREESESAKSKTELVQVKIKLETIVNENNELLKSLDKVENDMASKEHRIDKLEQVVETQLDSVEFLEEKLERTEDELFKMEDELKELEDRGVVNEEISRHERVCDIRNQRLSRMNSVKLSKEDILGEEASSSKIDPLLKRLVDLESWEKELIEREKQLDADREQYSLQEIRLSEWEKDLIENEKDMKDEALRLRERYSEDRLKELEGCQRILAEEEAVQREKEAVTEPKRESLREHERLFELANGPHQALSSDEMGREIALLRAECEDLLAEKELLVHTHEKKDKQRDQDLRHIEEEINKLRGLEIENQELRNKLEIADIKARRVDNMQITVDLLEEEMSSLKRAKKNATVDGNNAVQQLQEEIAEQLTELDEENQRLNDKLIQEEKRFKDTMEEKNSIILDLEEMLEELEKNLEAGASEEHTKALLKDLAEHKKENKSVVQLEAVLKEKVAKLEKKDSEILELKENLKQLEADGTPGDDSAGKDSQIAALRDELEATKAVIEAKTSDDYCLKLKREIKNLKIMCKGLKKRVKKEEQDSKARLKKKDESVNFMQKEIIRMKIELERRQERDKRREASTEKDDNKVIQLQIADLEDEIDHWKAVNIELEDELAVWKAEVTELKATSSGGGNDDTSDDDISIGSLQSLNSQVSKQTDGTMNLSHHSLSSVTQDDLFFVSDKSSVGAPPPASGSVEPSTPSQRAKRTLTDLWSKMTVKPPVSQNPAIPYTMGLDD